MILTFLENGCDGDGGDGGGGGDEKDLVLSPFLSSPSQPASTQRQG